VQLDSSSLLVSCAGSSSSRYWVLLVVMIHLPGKACMLRAMFGTFDRRKPRLGYLGCLGACQ